MNEEIIKHVINLEVERLLNMLAKSKEIENKEGIYFLTGCLQATIQMTANNLNQIINDNKSN